MNRQIKFRSWLTLENQMLNKFGIVYNNEPSETSRRVLMQYTGLKDKNGVEIYEGDIVRHEDLSIGCTVDLFVTGKVKMLEGGWLVDDGSKAEWLWSETAENEVIGNIYEHPHLLEESK